VSSTLDRQLERFRADPGDRRAFDALEEHLFLAGRWTDLVSLYEQRLAARDLASAPRERSRVLFRLGQVWGERRADPERAAECFRAAVAADPTCRPALAELRRLHLARGQWDVALQIAEAEAALDMSSEERAALLAEAGSLWLDELGDAEQALAHLERALQFAPDHELALDAAARACRALGRSAEAAGHLQRLADQLSGPPRAAALVAWAQLLAGPLEQPRRATELYRRALTDDPRNLEALEALAAAAEAAEQWSLLPDLYERRFQLAEDDARRAQVALAAGRLQLEHLANPDAARVWLRRAAQLGCDDARLFAALVELERQSGDEAALRRALEGHIAASGERPAVADLLELASLLSDAGDDAAALAYLQRALALAPEDSLVVEALSDTLTRLGRYEELVDCLERRAALAGADPATRAFVLAELGMVHVEHLGDPEASQRAYARALDADPGCREAFAALEKLYRKAERWDALRELLERGARSGPRERRAASWCELGELLREREGDAEAAAGAFEAALALDRGQTSAYRGLQRLAADRGDEEALLRAWEREAEVTSHAGRLGHLVRELARMLEGRGRREDALAWARRWVDAAPESVDALRLAARLHQELGHDDALLAALQSLDPLLQSGEQAANRRRMGALHSERARPTEAIAAYRAALDADPADVEALRALVELLEQWGRPEELARARRSLAELLPAAERAACLDALARLLDERLGDLTGAVEALLRLAGTDGAPDDVEARLESLLERAGRFEELAERLERRAREQAPGSTEALGLGLRQARLLLEHLSRFDAAVGVYRELLARDPACGEARAGLERALRASGDGAGLAAFFGDQMRTHPAPAERDRFAFERAVILEDALDEVPEALEIYRRLSVSAADAEDRVRAAARLEVALERVGDWEALRSHWEEALGRCVEADRGAIHERLALLCHHRLADRDAAIAHYEASAALSPGRAELWQILAQLYEETERSRDLVQALEAEIAIPAEPERERVLRVRAATLCAGVLAEPDRALGHYQRVLELDPGDTAASEFVVSRLEADGRLEEVARMLERRLDALGGQPRDGDGEWTAQRTSLRLRIAGLRAGPLDDPDGAIAMLEPGVGEIGARAVLAEPLADLYQRIGYHEELVSLCRRAAACSEPGPERAGWYCRLGDTLRRRNELREAAEAYRRALDEAPQDRDAQTALRDLYRRLSEAEPLAHLLSAELAALTGPDEIPLRMELAKLLSGRLGRPAEALLHLRRVVQLDPGHAEALERGLELAEHLERPGLVAELLDAALARPQPPAARATLLTRRGRLYAGLPDRTREAIADYREALALEPTRGDVRRALRQLLEAAGDFEGVLDCLHQEARLAQPGERAALAEHAAGLAWEKLSPDAALPWLERLRRERPGDARVVARMAEAHRLAGRPAARLRALEEQTLLASEDQGRRDLLLTRARVLERDLAAPARACAVLEEARALVPADSEVLRQLERLYRELGRQRERACVLETLAAGAAPHERIALWCEAATLYSERLGDPQRAADLLLRAVEATPRASALRAELLRTLGGRLRAAGLVDAWARCAENELALLDPAATVFDERRLALRRELADFYEGCGRVDACLRHLRRLADEAPPHFDHEGEVERALLRGLRAQGNWVELERRLADHLGHHPEDPEAWLELARLRDEKLAARGAAAQAYREVLRREPHCLPALRGLRAVAEWLSDWEEVARTLEGELEHAQTRRPAERSALLRRLGDVCWHELHSTTRASRSYAAALEANPEDFAAHHALEQLLESMEDWRGALDLYESEVEVLGLRDPERRREAWLRAGEIARDHTGELARALRAYVRAAEIAALPLPRRAERAELHLRCGDLPAFAEVFASWCDDPQSPATASDHARLAETLEQLGRGDEALARAQRALACDPQAWRVLDLAARLHAALGDPVRAAQALERAAQLAGDGRAAERLLRAAELRGDEDRAGATQLVRRAAALDPASPAVQAALAQAALHSGDHAEAEQAAVRALDLGAADASLAPEAILEVALVGARAARARGRTPAAAQLFEAALAVAPDHAEALAGAGEAHAAAGDLARARKHLEALLAQAGADPEEALHRASLARCLEAAGEPEAALVQCEKALAADPRRDDAFDLCVALHEAAGRVDAGIAALERRAAAEPDAARRAAHLLRAARWERRAGERAEAAERHLRESLEADPGCAEAWQELSSHLWQLGRTQAALEAASEGLGRAGSAAARASLALTQARARERMGERAEAARAYGVAAEADPRCVEAAIAQARLLRAAGDWRGAADALDAFVAGHPGDDPLGLAEALQQLGRLRAGPLEDVEGAIAAYRRAVELAPDELELRAMLAQLLAHRPDDWREALAHLASVLSQAPTHLPCLRSALGIARSHAAAAAPHGLALLRGLGAATPAELELAPTAFDLRLGGDAGLEDALSETLRQAVQALSDEIGQALEAPRGPAPAPEGDGFARFRAAVLAAEAELGAPGLLPLPSERVGDVLECLVALAGDLDPATASGSVLNALSAALGRRARRRLRRLLEDVSPEAVRALDVDRWRSEVRALAAARAVDTTGCDLRTALLTLVCERGDESPRDIPDSVDLSPRVDACPEARSLLRCAVRAWLAEIEA
jgi:tetratricopeptide (TPR) repeat protein